MPGLYVCTSFCLCVCESGECQPVLCPHYNRLNHSSVTSSRMEGKVGSKGEEKKQWLMAMALNRLWLWVYLLCKVTQTLQRFLCLFFLTFNLSSKFSNACNHNRSHNEYTTQKMSFTSSCGLIRPRLKWQKKRVCDWPFIHEVQNFAFSCLHNSTKTSTIRMAASEYKERINKKSDKKRGSVSTCGMLMLAG